MKCVEGPVFGTRDSSSDTPTMTLFTVFAASNNSAQVCENKTTRKNAENKFHRMYKKPRQQKQPDTTAENVHALEGLAHTLVTKQ